MFRGMFTKMMLNMIIKIDGFFARTKIVIALFSYLFEWCNILHTYIVLSLIGTALTYIKLSFNDVVIFCADVFIFSNTKETKIKTRNNSH